MNRVLKAVKMLEEDPTAPRVLTDLARFVDSQGKVCCLGKEAVPDDVVVALGALFLLAVNEGRMRLNLLDHAVLLSERIRDAIEVDEGAAW